MGDQGRAFWVGFGVHCAVGFDEMQGQCSVVHGLPERTPRDESVCCAAMLPLPRQWVEGMAQRRVDTGAHSTRLETRTKESIVITSSMVESHECVMKVKRHSVELYE